MNVTDIEVNPEVEILKVKVERLENLVNALISKINLEKAYSEADINGCRHTEGEQATSIDRNEADISYVAMMTDVELPE